MISIYFYAVAILYLSAPSEAKWRNCSTDDSYGELTKLEITSCDVNADGRCVLKRNSQGTLTLGFKAVKDIPEVKALVHGIVFDVPVPFNLPNANGCKDSGLECPLKSGGNNVYISTLPIEKRYPKVFVDVKWELVIPNADGTTTPIVCVIIPSKVI